MPEVITTVVIREPTTVTVVTPNTDVVEASSPGPQGPSGAAAGVFAHTQGSAQSTWVVNHNLGVEPDVTVIIDGEEVFPDVIHNSPNQTSLVFSSPRAGKARFRP